MRIFDFYHQTLSLKEKKNLENMNFIKKSFVYFQSFLNEKYVTVDSF